MIGLEKMDNFDKYKEMYTKGLNPEKVYLIAKSDSLDTGACIRMLRAVFNLSLIEAKEIMIVANKQGRSLQDYQEKLIDDLSDILEDNN